MDLRHTRNCVWILTLLLIGNMPLWQCSFPKFECPHLYINEETLLCWDKDSDRSACQVPEPYTRVVCAQWTVFTDQSLESRLASTSTLQNQHVHLNLPSNNFNIILGGSLFVCFGKGEYRNKWGYNISVKGKTVKGEKHYMHWFCLILVSYVLILALSTVKFTSLQPPACEIKLSETWKPKLRVSPKTRTCIVGHFPIPPSVRTAMPWLLS